ncbi:MAG: haloacid dehalogenase [Anaerolineales bacterium]|nr:haloacid dehalogenase [Anaerolineales bacterium]
MNRFESIAELIHAVFETRTKARDKALSQTRTLTRKCAHAIRAIHRDELQLAKQNLDEARQLVNRLLNDLSEYPELLYAGYTQDALKEFAEASIVYALIGSDLVPTPQDLGIEVSTYTNGLAETVGELRRRCLDILRHGYSEEAERLLNHMDDIYAVLITMDYPDAITGGLRRQTDIVRSLLERTRGDLTLSLRQQHLEDKIQNLEIRLDSDQMPTTSQSSEG